MPRGGHDDVVGRRLDRAERLAVDLAVGDHGREVVARVGAARRGHSVEVHEEVGDHVGVRIALFPLHVGIAAAEQFLSQLQHLGLVGLGHAQDRHDDMQRIVDRDVPGEIALRPDLHHPVDIALRELDRARLQALAQIDGHEPSLGQAAIGAVVLAVHVDQRAQWRNAAGLGVRSAPHRRETRLGLLVHQHRARLVVELVVELLDLKDVGVLGQRPIGPEAVGLSPVHGIGLAQIRKDAMQFDFVAIDGGIGDGVVDSGGHGRSLAKSARLCAPISAREVNSAARRPSLCRHVWCRIWNVRRRR